MKILAIGDFHGRFPEKLEKEAGKADLILSNGDYADAEKIRKIIFKNWTDKKWFEAIGLEKAKKLEKESFDSGLKVLKELNKIEKRVYFVFGNTDFYEKGRFNVGNYNKKIRKLRNLILSDKKRRKINGLEVIGFGGYLDATEYIKNPIDEDKKEQEKRKRRYDKEKRKLFKLFKKNPKNFIFLIHNPPYKIFDKVDYKDSPMHNKHVGFEPYNKIIKKYSPMLVICGHMHENPGIRKLGKSLIVNPGAAFQGKAALISLDEKKKKVLNCRFLR